MLWLFSTYYTMTFSTYYTMKIHGFFWKRKFTGKAWNWSHNLALAREQLYQTFVENLFPPYYTLTVYELFLDFFRRTILWVFLQHATLWLCLFSTYYTMTFYDFFWHNILWLFLRNTMLWLFKTFSTYDTMTFFDKLYMTFYDFFSITILWVILKEMSQEDPEIDLQIWHSWGNNSTSEPLIFYLTS